MPYTSGSTGKPKGCMHTHATVMFNVAGAVPGEASTSDAVALSTAPMFHVTGMQAGCIRLHAGATVDGDSRAGTPSSPRA